MTIVTRLRAEFWTNHVLILFPTPFRPGLVSIHPSLLWVARALLPSVKRPGHIAHLLVMRILRMRMSGAISPHFTCVFGVQLPIYFILMLIKVPYLLMFYTIVIKT